MKLVCTSVVSLFLALGCATSPAPSSTSGSTVATGSAASPAPFPLGAWLIVREVTGPGLRVGSGLRLRASGMDVSSGTLGSAMEGECVLAEDELLCSGMGPEIRATATTDGRVSMVQGPLSLVLEQASDAESSRFEAGLAASVAQRAACSEAAECCMAAETTLGTVCDLNVELGDRSLASCTRALDAARARFTSTTAPDVCQ